MTIRFFFSHNFSHKFYGYLGQVIGDSKLELTFEENLAIQTFLDLIDLSCCG